MEQGSKLAALEAETQENKAAITIGLSQGPTPKSQTCF
jgi:hypothetical protein